MNSKHQKILQAIFATPVSSSIEWADIESLLVTAGAVLKEGRGSRIRFVYGNERATFHRPHPEKEAKPYQVKDAKKFLEAIGVIP